MSASVLHEDPKTASPDIDAGQDTRPGSVHPDADMVQRLRRRQPGAFDQLYRCHADRIWRFLCRLVGRADLAQYLFQDTWLAAARNAHRLREDTQVLPWLYTIARNKHRNALRLLAFDRRRQAAVASQGEGLAGVDDLDTTADARARAQAVARVFPTLPEAHREILLLCLVESLATEEVARVLGLSPEAVRKRLSRARAALAQLLDRPAAGPTGGSP